MLAVYLKGQIYSMTESAPNSTRYDAYKGNTLFDTEILEYGPAGSRRASEKLTLYAFIRQASDRQHCPRAALISNDEVYIVFVSERNRRGLTFRLLSARTAVRPLIHLRSPTSSMVNMERVSRLPESSFWDFILASITEFE